jgi:hypothetical protein
MTGFPKKDPPATQPSPDSEEELLEEGLEETFPASDPPAVSREAPYWDTHPETD